jgi:2-polyprenyl-3-methyl-5-hydroxy-6-metoxy-1,4-benzoquinol methylase
MPLTEDIGKAYAHYYTHTSRDKAGRPGLLKQSYKLMRHGYWAGKYNYHTGQKSFLLNSIGRLLYLFPLRRSEADADVRFLQAMPQGRLLDVGCGSGEWLLSMRNLGWTVDGVDFDENAIRVARQKGLEVQCGSVEQQNFPDNSFDAVTLHHVIEHVPDPVKTLAECGRVLKKGGKLVVFTPNSSSLGHRIFKEYWRGLEPPRHLHLFSTKSLHRLLELAGFQNVLVRPQIARSVIYESILLWRGQTSSFPVPRRNWPAWLFARCFNIMELGLVKMNPSIADCIAGVALKE